LPLPPQAFRPVEYEALLLSGISKSVAWSSLPLKLFFFFFYLLQIKLGQDEELYLHNSKFDNLNQKEKEKPNKKMYINNMLRI